MRLYLDDDSVDPLLIRLLRKAKHDVRLPIAIGHAGSGDAVHFKNAIHEMRTLLSGNHDDYLCLHEVVIEAKGHHAGIFIVRRDNDPTRDLKPAGIVLAIANLSRANVPIDDEFHILNHWR